MTESRPNPEELLARVQKEESERSRGKLKIFLGAAAGVGKTYRMLESARELLSDGVDVVAGCVVTHGRKETEALLAGLEILPPKILEYRGTQFAEFDLDAALTRKPTYILVDELAHTNAPGCRHDKRWQDVEELLEAGINVDTTMNIQHLDSANDIVAQITNVTIRETVPDSFFERTDELELVDLPPDELIQRLKEGKVYVSEKIAFALENFFRKGNLIALRELALRSTANRVDKQMQKYRTDESVKQIWPAADRILVCVGPSPLSIKVVRTAKRRASALDAELLVAYVETPFYLRLPEKDRSRLIQTLRMAEQLGAKTTVLTGTNVSEELVSYAERKNVSEIIIGKPARPRWQEILFGSVVDEVIRRSGNIDVAVITGESAPPEIIDRTNPSSHVNYLTYGKAFVVVTIATLLAAVMFNHFALVNLVMIYQLAVVIIAVRWGRGPAIASSILSVAACDFFFIPPRFSFAVSDTQYLLTLAIMLITALTLSTLTFTARHQAEMAKKRERHTAALYSMTRDLAVAVSKEAVLATSAKHIKDVFDSKVAICLANDGTLSVVPALENSFAVDAHEFGVAQWVFINGQPAGAGTATLPGAKAIYMPLRGTGGIIGVIGVLASQPKRFLHPEEMHLLETFVNQIALAVERALLSEKAQQGA